MSNPEPLQPASLPQYPSWGPVTLGQLETIAASIVAAMTTRFNAVDASLKKTSTAVTKIGVQMAVQQSDLDAVAAAVTGVNTTLGAVQAQIDADNAKLATDVQNVAAAIAALGQANPALDLSSVNSAVSAAQATVAALQTSAGNLDTEEAAVAGLVPPAPPAA